MTIKTNKSKPQLNHLIDLHDYSLYGNEAADDEIPEYLNGYFVNQKEFKAFSDISNNFVIVKARKGVGKSALIKKTAYDLQNDNSVLNICIKGSDLTIQNKFSTGNIFELIFDWQQRICYRINVELGNEIGFALNDPDISLVEVSELSGFKNKNIIGCLLERLKFKISSIETNKNSDTSKLDNQQLITNYLVKNNKKIVCILIDDIDATFRNTKEERDLLATFFTACRELAFSVYGLKIRLSVRSNVWASIRTSNEALDKCEQYILSLSWSHRGTQNILAKRIQNYLQIKAKKCTRPKNTKRYLSHINSLSRIGLLSLIFDDDIYEKFHLYSSGRPRWALQLFRLSANVTSKVSSKKKIKENHIHEVLYKFGRCRFYDIIAEHIHQCPQIEELMYSFSENRTNFSIDELLDHLGTVLENEAEVIIDCTPSKNPLQLAHFLFRCGFIFAREIYKNNNHRHYTYDNKPHLLKNKYCLHEELIWSIHPSFWSYLRLTDKKRKIQPHPSKNKSLFSF